MMKNLVVLATVFFSIATTIAAMASEPKTPLPVPARIRVADSKPREVVWDRLTHKEKKLAFHLIEASRAGRAILFHMNHRHGLVIKRLLESVFSAPHIEDTKALLGAEAFKELLNYAAKFEDLASPYESSNRKYILAKATPQQLENLFKIYSDRVDAKTRTEVIALLTDPTVEVMQMPEDEAGSTLAETGGNYYQKGISGAEVRQALDGGLALTGCLNCRVVRAQDGGLRLETQTINTPGIVGKALKKVVRELRLALPYASSEHQKKQLEHTILFFEQGDIEDFRQANIEWVRDGHGSKVDFMMGFVETYQDYLNQIGSWESYVQIVDPMTTEKSVRLAANAQYFEEAMPYGQFKKIFPKGYSPPALMVYYFQEISSMRSGGYNLPNFDDIRRDFGAKNIIRLSLPGEENSPQLRQIRREYLEAFLPTSLVERSLEHMDSSWRTLVLLHEIIGHGSGTYDATKYGDKQDPVSALGALGSALEEQRADLTALVFAADPKLVEVGLYKDQAEANLVRDVMYDTYLADFLRHLAKARSLTEAHQRGNWLLVNLLIENGAAAWVTRDGAQAVPGDDQSVLAVRDYQKFQAVSRDLLAELQRIKAVRDDVALKKLFAEKAPLAAADEAWAQSIILRGANLAVNAGAVEQPWSVNRTGSFKTLSSELTLEGVSQYWKHQ